MTLAPPRRRIVMDIAASQPFEQVGIYELLIGRFIEIGPHQRRDGSGNQKG